MQSTACTLELVPHEGPDCENVNGTLIKQSEGICNYSNHGHIMEKTYMRMVPFDSFCHLFMCSCGFNTAVHLGTKSNDTFSLLQKPVRLRCSHITNVHRHWPFRRIRCWYWFTVGDMHRWSLRRGLVLKQTGVSSGIGQDSSPTAVKYWQDTLDK